MNWSRRKRVLFTGGALLGALMLIVAVLPLWWPWLFRPVGERWGLTFRGYEREGYSRFALTEVAFTNATTTFRAERVEGWVPTVWLWRRFFGPEEAHYLRGLGWQLTLRASGKDQDSRSASVHAQVQEFEAVIKSVAKWIPRAELLDGVVQVRKFSLAWPRAGWTNGQLIAQFALTNSQHSAALSARFQKTPYKLELDSSSLDWHSAIQISSTASGLTLLATNRWLTNRIEASARFGREGALPETARVEATAFTIPARLVGLEEFDHLTGAFLLEWQTNRYALRLSAGAAPLSDRLPPVDLVARVTGDFEAAFIEQARISAPWIAAELTQQTEVKFSSPFLAEDVGLELFVDLSGQPWFPARGELRGQARFRPGPGRIPPFTFAVSGAGIHVSNIQTKVLGARGVFNWPWLELSGASVEMTDGSLAAAVGKMNLETRVVERGEVEFNGRFGQQWLPAGVTYGAAKATANLSGPFNKLTHSGTLKVDRLVVPRVRQFDLAANWRGQGSNVTQARISMEAGATSLLLEGAADLESPAKTLRLGTFTLSQNGQSKMTLQRPSAMVFRPGTATQAWNLDLRSFDWRGESGHVQLGGAVSWPHSGRLSGAVGGLHSDLVAEIVHLPVEQVEVGQLGFSAGWSNGPVQFQFTLAGAAARADGVSFSAEGSVKADAQGVSVEKLSLSSQKEPLATANGFLPVAFFPAQTKILQIRPEGRVQLGAVVRPNAFFWKELAKRRGLAVSEPELAAHVTGTWSEPLGALQFRAQHVKFDRAERDVPPVENLALKVSVKPELVNLEALTFSVANQPVALSGQIPLPKGFWQSLPGNVELPDWQKGTARLKIESAEIAALTPFLSDLLTPAGVFNADVSLQPGGQFDGRLTIDGANTRPLDNLGPIRDIRVVTDFEGRRLHFESTAAIGGQAAFANGHADLSGEEWFRAGHLPPFQLKLTGSNVPLTRQAEAIVRADLDLAFTNAPGRANTISGAVRLRDSFFLHDLAVLAPGGATTPGRRPPYFSFEHKPFAEWRLNVVVTGDKFLKVRSPLFRGAVSANLQVEGTLQNPVAVGELRIPSGTVRLPFASLPITQGFVTLSSDNPFQPQLYVTAAARVFSFDVKMEVSGSADNPVIQFSSTPPLTSEQILLMVMAGEMPRSDFSLSSQQRAQRMALYLGQSILSELGFSGDANRLTIRSGENVSEAGKPTYSVEYKLPGDWAVVGEYDRFNDYNLMLKWRVYPW